MRRPLLGTVSALALLCGPAAADSFGINDAPGLVTLAPSGVVARSLAQRAEDRLTLEDLGGGTDKTPDANCVAFQSVKAKGRTIRLGDGSYQVNCTITEVLAATGRPISLIGNGSDRTQIVNTTTNLPTLVVPAYTQYGRIEGLTLARSATPVAGAHGLVVNDNVSHMMIVNVRSTGNYIGAIFKQTDNSIVQNFEATGNANHGVLITNDDTTAGNHPAQWNWTGHNLANGNGGDGYRIQSNAGALAAGAGQIVLGTMRGLASYGNAGCGFAAYGAAGMPIQDLRLSDYFFGEDGGTEVYLDTYGKDHRLGAGFIELSGAYGLYATANNTGLMIAGGAQFSATKRNAIFSLAPKTFVSGVSVASPGTDTAQSATDRAGIVLNGANSGLFGSIVDGGTYGAIIGGANSTVTGLLSLNASVQPLQRATDTIARGVRGSPDAN